MATLWATTCSLLATVTVLQTAVTPRSLIHNYQRYGKSFASIFRVDMSQEVCVCVCESLAFPQELHFAWLVRSVVLLFTFLPLFLH